MLGGIALATLLGYHSAWPTLDAFAAWLDHSPILFFDFVNHYHPQAREIWTSTTPVPGFLYPATFAWLLAPLGRLPLDKATALWGVAQATISVAAAIPLAFLVFPLRSQWPWRLTYTVLCLTSVAFLHNFKWGQVSVLVTACSIAGMLFAPPRGQASLVGGALLGFAASIKYYPALLGIVWLASKQWRALAAAIVTGVVLTTLPAVPMGVEAWTRFNATPAQALERGFVVQGPNSQFMPRVVLDVFGLPWDVETRSTLVQVSRIIGGACLAFAACSAWRRRRQASRPDTTPIGARGLALPAAVAFLAVPFLVATSWTHYLAYLPFCQVVLAHEAVERWRGTERTRATLALGLVAASIWLASSPFLLTFPDWDTYASRGYGFGANALLLVAAAVVELRIGRRGYQPPA